MGRSVSVKLLLDAAKAISGAKDFATAVETVGDNLADTAREGDRAGRAIDAAGDEMSEAARAASSLDRQIDQLNRSLRELAIAQSLGLDVGKQLRAQEAEIRRATRTRKLIPDDDEARGLGARLGAMIGASTSQGVFGALTASFRSPPPQIYAGVGVLAAALAPTLGAAMAGAVVGAAGVGGVVGGVVLASKDPRVKAAATDLKTQIGMELKDAAQPFVPATVDALGKVRVAFATSSTDIKGIFADSADYLDPLVQGALDGARKFIGGFSDAVGDAGPVVDALGRSLSTIGGAVGDSFSVLADDADEGASALDDLTSAATNFIKTGTGVVHVLSEIKGGFDDADTQIDRFRYFLEDGASKSHTFTKGLDLTADGFKKGSAEAEAYRRQTLGIATAADENTLRLAAMTQEERNAEAAAKATAASQDMVSDAMGQAAFVTDMYRNALNSAAGSALSAAEANLGFRQAVDAAKNAVDHKKGVTIQEEQALLGMVRAANSSTQAMDASGTAAKTAERKFNDQRAAIVAAAEKMGYGRKKANELADALLQIPKNVKPKVDVDTGKAIAGVRNLQHTINGLHGKTIRINTIVTGEFGADDIGAKHGNRWGGMYTHAQEGVLRDAAVYSAASPARYAYAEPATGGEAFIPRHGDMARSRGIATQVVHEWLGGSVRWPDTTGAATQTAWSGTAGGSPSSSWRGSGAVAPTAARSGPLRLEVVAGAGGSPIAQAAASALLGLLRTGQLQLQVAPDGSVKGRS